MGTWSEYLPIGSKDIGVRSGVGGVYIPDVCGNTVSLESIKGDIQFYDNNGNRVNKDAIVFDVDNFYYQYGVQNTVIVEASSKNCIPLSKAVSQYKHESVPNGIFVSFDSYKNKIEINNSANFPMSYSVDLYNNIPLERNKRYILSGVPERLRSLGIYLHLVGTADVADKNLDISTINANEVEFVTPNTTNIVYNLTLGMNMNTPGPLYNDIVTPMIRLSGFGDSNASLYKDKDRYTLYITQPLYRIDDVYDEMCKLNGNWVYVKRIQYENLSSNPATDLWEPIQIDNNHWAWRCTNFLSAIDKLNNPETYSKACNGKILCSILPVYDNIRQLTNNGYGIVSTGDTVIIMPEKNGSHHACTEAVEFCSWLNSHSVYLYYETASPSIISVPEPATGTGLSHPRVLDTIPYKGDDTIVRVYSVAYADSARTKQYAMPELSVSYAKTPQGAHQISANVTYEETAKLCAEHDKMLNGYTLCPLSQDEYNSLSSFDSHTLYLIIES